MVGTVQQILECMMTQKSANGTEDGRNYLTSHFLKCHLTYLLIKSVTFIVVLLPSNQSTRVSTL